MHPEQTLLVQARQFDQRALAEIYDRYSPGIYRYAWRSLGDVDLAEECLAETFRRFLEALKRGAGPGQHLKAYLYRVAHNWISDYYRRRPPEPVSLDERELPDPDADPDEGAQLAIWREQLWSALAELTPDQRQVIVLKYLEGWSNADIAQALDKPLGAVKSLRNRGVQALKKNLAAEEFLPDGND
jgi:RNA polymerase sigma-70 factor (ECF subfamily)